MIARGYQPAVVKVVSYARGATRATATGHYVQRDDVVLETYDGRVLRDKSAVGEEIRAWSKDFERRAESQDVVNLRLRLAGVRDDTQGRAAYDAALAAGLEGHRYAYQLESQADGSLSARAVVAMAGPSRERFRVQEQRIGSAEAGFSRRVLDPASEAAVKARIEAATAIGQHRMSLEPGGSSHSRDGVTFRLNQLLEGGPAKDDRGQVLATVNDARLAGRDWGPSLRSQSSRDTVHLMVSAKAGTDVTAFTAAVRGFLHAQFGAHRFMFGVHTDKAEEAGHIHAHAVITVRNENGRKIHPGPRDFGQWRENYAEHARDQGLRIVATSAAERASRQSYGARDKAIVDAADRPRAHRVARDRAYAADPGNQALIANARQRIAQARMNPIRIPRGQKDWCQTAAAATMWGELRTCEPENALVRQLAERTAEAVVLGLTRIRPRQAVGIGTGKGAGVPITAEQMKADLTAMNETVGAISAELAGDDRAQFDAAAERFLMSHARRVELQTLSEQGVTHLSRDQLARMFGSEAAARMIEGARSLEARESQEAREARQLAELATERERRDAGRARPDPQQLTTDREIAEAARAVAAREAQEAAIARDVVRQTAEGHVSVRRGSAAASGDEREALRALKVEQERIIAEETAKLPPNSAQQHQAQSGNQAQGEATEVARLKAEQDRIIQEEAASLSQRASRQRL